MMGAERVFSGGYVHNTNHGLASPLNGINGANHHTFHTMGIIVRLFFPHVILNRRFDVRDNQDAALFLVAK
jgi:hypothetical protein